LEVVYHAFPQTKCFSSAKYHSEPDWRAQKIGTNRDCSNWRRYNRHQLQQQRGLSKW
jgi:hypothetical protein